MLRSAQELRPGERSMLAAYLQGRCVLVEAFRLGIAPAAAQALTDSALFKMLNPEFIDWEGEPLYTCARGPFPHNHYAADLEIPNFMLLNFNNTALYERCAKEINKNV